MQQSRSRTVVDRSLRGVTEDAGRENDGTSKWQRVKTQDIKMQYMNMHDINMRDLKML